jgi:hypothetical protein
VELVHERRGEERRGRGGGGEVGAGARAAHDPRRLVVGARRVLGRLERAQPYPRLPAGNPQRPTRVIITKNSDDGNDARAETEQGRSGAVSYTIRTGEGGGSRRPRSPSGAAARRGTVAAAGPLPDDGAAAAAVAVDDGAGVSSGEVLPWLSGDGPTTPSV